MLERDEQPSPSPEARVALSTGIMTLIPKSGCGFASGIGRMQAVGLWITAFAPSQFAAVSGGISGGRHRPHPVKSWKRMVDATGIEPVTPTMST